MVPHALEEETYTRDLGSKSFGMAELGLKDFDLLPEEILVEYAAWSLPKSETGELRGKARWVTIKPRELFFVGGLFLKPTGYLSDQSSTERPRLSRFRSTTSTRCVRDIKRDFSWKIYGVCCNQETQTHTYYVRVKFDDEEKDKLFSDYARLLDAIAAKRYLKSSCHPFGVGYDPGVPTQERVYIITNCAKQTPYLRKVSVDLEVYLDDVWKTLPTSIDRLGFATYKSASKRSIKTAKVPQAINFIDDAYLRFARVTLRFGQMKERTIVDIESSGDFSPQIEHSRTSSTITVQNCRVRNCDGSEVSIPIRTKIRLIFRERGRNSGFLRSHGKNVAAEAEKVFTLLKKTTKIAEANSLCLPEALEDQEIFEMNLRRIASDHNYAIRLNNSPSSFKTDLSNLFHNSTIFMTPVVSSNSMLLTLQSRNGQHVLRQHVPSPIRFIGSITSTGFSGSEYSKLKDVSEGIERNGKGIIQYIFENGEDDSVCLVEKVVSILEIVDAHHPVHPAPHTSIYAPPPISSLVSSPRISRFSNPFKTHPSSHKPSRRRKTISNLQLSSASATSLPNTSRSSRMQSYSEPPPANADPYDFDDIFKIYEADAETVISEEEAREDLEGGGMGTVLCRVRCEWRAEDESQLDLAEGDLVIVEAWEEEWCMACIASGAKIEERKGWVPRDVLDPRPFF
ncbi:hypothetical protein RUND412_011112 [Rhizina undulata]